VARPFSRKIVVSIVLLVAGFAILFGVGLRGSLVYYLTVGEFLDRQGREDLGENFRINGTVVPGSIRKNADLLGARFLMTDGSRRLAVAYGKETPDTFVDGSEVVVEGSLGPEGTFQAHTLLAKCPSKYEPQNRGAGASGEPAPGYGASAPSETDPASQ
jgi:cytochrome c-type biogenesis protein CcmE